MVAFSVGVLYLWVMFLRPGGAASWLNLLDPEARQTIAMLFLAVVLVLNWSLQTSETPFPFTLAETQFLFAAPMTRRQVLLFKIFRSQMALGLSAVVTVFLFRRGAWSLGHSHPRRRPSGSPMRCSTSTARGWALLHGSPWPSMAWPACAVGSVPWRSSPCS